MADVEIEIDDELVSRFRVTTGISESDISDDDLQILLNESDSDINLAAAAHFDREATKYSRLVNVSESGSSRELGSLYKNATALADRYRARATDAAAGAGQTSGYARTRIIVRAES